MKPVELRCAIVAHVAAAGMGMKMPGGMPQGEVTHG